MKIVAGLLTLSVAAGLVLVGCYPPDMEPLGGPEVKAKGLRDVTNYEQLSKTAEVSVYGVRHIGQEGGSGEWLYVDLAVRNKGPVAMRLLNLVHEALLIDEEGFAIDLKSEPEDLTVPADAKRKLRLTFVLDHAKAKTLRLYGHDYPLPAGKAGEGAGAGQ